MGHQGIAINDMCEEDKIEGLQKVVVRMLEREEDNLVMPPNPFAFMGQTSTSVKRRKASVQLGLTVISEIE